MSALESAFPEFAGRVRAAEAPEADRETLERVHASDYLDRVEAASAEARRTGGQVPCGEETPLSGGSWSAIVESSGATVEAASRVARGLDRNAFVVSRPPGHHALPARAMGFCPVNHVAVAARALQATGSAERVLVVDWDVHHGNGTQDVFWEDGTVYYLSVHQAPFYPGTGADSERGEGEGLGTTLNVPVSAGVGPDEYVAVFLRALAQAEEEFEPDIVLVSAGYDALADDPLGGLFLEPDDFSILTGAVMEIAARRCGGRVVACLEGGYHPKRTAQAVVATIRTLANAGAP